MNLARQNCARRCALARALPRSLSVSAAPTPFEAFLRVIVLADLSASSGVPPGEVRGAGLMRSLSASSSEDGQDSNTTERSQ